MTDTHGHVYPMVGPGMGYKEMITGKWIPGREKEDDKGSGGGTPTGYF
jgi:acetolactate synthase-1/2/3 large subunit